MGRCEVVYTWICKHVQALASTCKFIWIFLPLCFVFNTSLSAADYIMTWYEYSWILVPKHNLHRYWCLIQSRHLKVWVILFLWCRNMGHVCLNVVAFTLWERQTRAIGDAWCVPQLGCKWGHPPILVQAFDEGKNLKYLNTSK